MSRPSHNLDKKLIDTARAMLPRTGFSGLKVREVIRQARVNPGMFHYHFKSREAFIHRVLEEVYEDFLITFRGAADGPGRPRQRLRNLLVAVAKFARDNRVFYTLMIRELLNAEPGMARFAKANFPRHVALLTRLMDECRREGSVRPLPNPMLCMFAMSSMALPALAVTGFERNRIRSLGGIPLEKLSGMILSDEMIKHRADMVMAALAATQ